MEYLKKIYDYIKRPKVYKTLILVGIGAGFLASRVLSPRQVAITAFIAALT
jgi:hypothetical protein